MENNLQALVERARLEALTRPDMGRTVRVVRGRKVPLGTEGVVVFNALRPVYNRGRHVATVRRLGIRDASGAVHYTAATNVEVLR